MTTWMTATPADVEIAPGVLDQEKIRTLHHNTSMFFFMKYSGLENKDVKKLTKVAIPYMIETQTKYSELVGIPMTNFDIGEWMATDNFYKHLSFLVSNALEHDPDFWEGFYEFYQESEQERKKQLGI